jgi:hypothetical protein
MNAKLGMYSLPHLWAQGPAISLSKGAGKGRFFRGRCVGLPNKRHARGESCTFFTRSPKHGYKRQLCEKDSVIICDLGFMVWILNVSQRHWTHLIALLGGGGMFKSGA